MTEDDRQDLITRLRDVLERLEREQFQERAQPRPSARERARRLGWHGLVNAS